MPGITGAPVAGQLTRVVRWMLVASVAFFAASLWLVSGRSAGQQPPVATVRQIMDVMVIPASKIVYGAAGTVSTAAGTIDVAPETDAEWNIVAANAAILAEAGALLMVEGRAHRGNTWMGPAQELIKGATNTVAAAKAKSVDALLDAGGEIANACDTCHAEYLPNGGR